MASQTYYHFLSSEHAIADLGKERIKVSLINELNDPFELLPYLRYGESEKRKGYHKIRATVSKKYGLLCFSKKWEDPLLWGHYADKHKGVAIGFEVLKDDVFDIKYTDKRSKFDLTESREMNENLFLNLARAKYERWSYEAESRIVIKLGDCESEKNHYFLPFQGRLRVKEIVLGCKFDKNEQGEIGQVANRLGAKVILARQGWGDYKILKDGNKTNVFNVTYF